ncbi:methyl-accepting chemotaxis protein [Ensifer canadensis]|uniref:methyl-accepting chemotaxis protein n=1 Tax=Ensifer canadensis TaxID=555315 RepID=UPI001F2EB43F|nr:methyl-accepting chemotaxis protein [Ensifer canadensis]
MRHFVRTNGPIILFASMTIAGSLIIWFGKLYGFDTATITLIPLSMMALYFAISFLAAGLRLHNEQAGDNLYYMGFLFTLTSLGISLYQFTGEASIENVVRNFGIAISSTIAGITLRILFNQMRRDPIDIERATRHELAEMTRRVRTELDSSAIEFANYRRTSNQMLAEGFEEIARQAERNGEAVRAAIETMAMKATQPIEDASVRLTATLETTHQQIIEFAARNAATVAGMSEKLNASVAEITGRAEELAGAMDGVIKKYASARSPEEVLKIEVSPALESMQTLIQDHAKALGENAANTRDAAKKVLAAIAPFKQTSAALPSLVDQLKDTIDASKNSSEVTSQLFERIERSSSALDRSGDTLAKLGDTIAQAIPATIEAASAQKRAADQFSAMLEVLKDNLTVTNSVAQNLVSISEQTSANSGQLKQTASMVEKVAELADRTALKMETLGQVLPEAQSQIEIDPALAAASVSDGAVVEDKAKRGWFGR